MKKFLPILIAVLIVAMTFVFASCDDSNSPQPSSLTSSSSSMESKRSLNDER